jgi:hypothetical protein
MNAKSIVLSTHTASIRASDDDKQRARKAALSLVKNDHGPWVFNAFLNLLHRGAPATEANILSEAMKVAAAETEFRQSQQHKHAERSAA